MKRVPLIQIVLAILLTATVSVAQTTAFTYQGRLTDAGNPASGSFQMQFKLFDSLNGGTQIGSTLTDLPVTVNQGIFSVRLDFGSAALTGANRWLEIAVRHNSGESYSTLSPREQLASSPYSVRTISAASADLALDSQKLGGVNASQFVQTTDARLSDARNPLPGNTNYIQNTGLIQNGTVNLSGAGIFGGVFTDQRLSVGAITAPGHRLGIFNGIPWTSNGWGGAIEMQNAAAIGWRSNGAGSRFGIGQSAGGLYFFRTASDPGTTGSPANYDMTISDTGNVGIGTITPASKVEIAAQDGLRITGFQPYITLRDGSTNAFIQNVGGNLYMLASNVSQNPDKTGLVKFGILVNADGSLNLCFNAQNPVSCGVTVSHPSAGQYDLTFPVQINSRIISATMVLQSNFTPDLADEIYARPTSTQTVRVRTIETTGSAPGYQDTGFYLVVF